MRSMSLAAMAIALGLPLVVTVSHAAPVIAVTTANVNVRQNPGGNAISTLPSGTTVGVLGFEDPWAQVVFIRPQTAKGQHGWIHIQYLQAVRNQRGRRSVGVSGDHCEIEFDTDAEVCVRVRTPRHNLAPFDLRRFSSP